MPTVSDDKEVIVVLGDWILFKGTQYVSYTNPQRYQGRTSHGSATSRGMVKHTGNWIQHNCCNSWRFSTIWQSWEPKSIDNKCPHCHVQISETDLAKLLCFGKAIK